jgi:hypothetical protein
MGLSCYEKCPDFAVDRRNRAIFAKPTALDPKNSILDPAP